MSLGNDLYLQDMIECGDGWESELSEREAITMAEFYCAEWMESGGPVPAHIEAMGKLGLLRDCHVGL